MIRFGSVCSGIEAASCAWVPLGWTPVFHSEIKAFPRAVLARRWPEVPCHGDFRTIGPDDYDPIDVLVGGTPCQSFSIAGLRSGLDDELGVLALDYLRLAQRLRPRWLVWENVPGVLSAHKGQDFGCFLGALAELGYGWAYRVLDARYFGVPQRRRRVILVGHLGDWRRAGAVLFEREGLQGDSAPRRYLRPADPGRAAAGPGAPDRAHVAAFGGNNHRGEIEVATALSSHGGSHGRLDFKTETLIAFSVRGRAGGSQAEVEGEDVAPALRASPGGSSRNFVAYDTVRRLTPLECERLQGFPDGYTDIPFVSRRTLDGHRYEVLGDSMAVPVMRWLGERVALADQLELLEAA